MKMILMIMNASNILALTWTVWSAYYNSFVLNLLLLQINNSS